MKNNFKPPFKWAGAKNRMYEKYVSAGFFPASTSHDLFVDVFGGTGCVSMWVRDRYPNLPIVLNDNNRYIVEMYKTMISDTEDFVKEYNKIIAQYSVLNVSDRKKMYYQKRDEYRLQYAKLGRIKENATLLYLIQTGFNGIWQTMKESGDRYATPSGLQKSNGNSVTFSESRLRKYIDYLRSFTITCDDFEKCMLSYENAWLYCDPPYRDTVQRYGSSFNDDKQALLVDTCKLVSKSGNLVSMSNKEVDNWFSSRFDHTWNFKIFNNVKYTAGRHNKGFGAKATEVLIKNY